MRIIHQGRSVGECGMAATIQVELSGSSCIRRRHGGVEIVITYPGDGTKEAGVHVRTQANFRPEDSVMGMMGIISI